jgi:hypothetical protein
MVGGAVVGFTNAAGTYRAYNLGVTTFATAWGALRANDNFYGCGHGGVADNGNKGGVIQLDGGTSFNGFIGATFAMGTRARAALAAYPALPAPPGRVTVFLHYCFSGANPGVVSVSATLADRNNVVISHDHMTAARASLTKSVEGGTAAQQATAQAAINGFRVGNSPFRTQYTDGQAVIDAAVPPAGTVNLHLTYGDTGNAPDPANEEQIDFCPPAISAPEFPVVGVLLVATVLAAGMLLYRKRYVINN